MSFKIDRNRYEITGLSFIGLPAEGNRPDADPETAAWLREKGDANGGREFKRSYERAVEHVKNRMLAQAASEFDVEPAP